MVSKQPFKNPKRTYRFWYYRATLGGRVCLHVDILAWDEMDARMEWLEKTKDYKYTHIGKIDIID